MIDILFFRPRADMQGKRRLAMAFPEDGLSLFALRLRLFDGEVDGRMRMSVNQVMMTADQSLQDGDEVPSSLYFPGADYGGYQCPSAADRI